MHSPVTYLNSNSCIDNGKSSIPVDTPSPIQKPTKSLMTQLADEQQALNSREHPINRPDCKFDPHYLLI